MKIVERSKLWVTISAIVILAGLISLAVQGLNLGIDFTSGNLLELQFEKQITEEQINSVLEEHDLLQGSSVQNAENNIKLIRTKVIEDNTEKMALLKDVKEKVGSYELLRDEKVGPTIGKELTQKALLALLIASIGMVIYITWRFELSFAISAILTLLHDVLVVVGVLSILQLEISAPFVAAILTLIGYSINDTIVIFDRVRENMKKRSRKEGFGVVVNTSISQTIVRSLNTSVTTLLTLATILFFGGLTIKSFTFTLLIGVFVGTYSSIFVASPMWVWIKNRKKGTSVAA